MLDKGYYWRNRELRQHVSVIDGKEAPTMILANGVYLNMFTKKWIKANIWIVHDRVIYVGDKMPERQDGTEIIDCEGKYLVPGYIEPHSHPSQIYNPESLADHAAKTGTTTLVNDNLLWLFLMERKKAFSLLDDFSNHPVSMYWWSRYDAQTVLQDDQEKNLFNTNDVLKWISHPAVVQGGELTSWPRMLSGDDRLLYWIQETKQRGKPVEGHFPGASENTLTKMKLLGISGDHESMTGEEVIRRLEMGYHTALRYSSIRPDLPNLIEELLAAGLTTFDNLSMTTDGSTSTFYEKGIMNVCIDIAIQKGIPVEDAYRMGSYNAAKHFQLDEQLGSIAPGRIAHINILTEKDNPTPESVLAKGEWIVKETKEINRKPLIDWKAYDIEPLELGCNLTEKELQFSAPLGLEMINQVIMKPYALDVDITPATLSKKNKEAFLLLMDKNGKWRINSTIRGFTKELGALASSYSTTGDLVFIGKSKPDIIQAADRLKEIGGGIVLVNGGEVLLEIPLSLSGFMYQGSMEELIKKEKLLKKHLTSFGYPFDDPIYSIFFLSSTHLPYVRITPQGIIDVMKNEVLFPAIMN